MKRKRFVKVLMGRLGLSRDEANGVCEMRVSQQRAVEAENRRKRNERMRKMRP